MVKISILKGKGLNLRAEPPRIKLYRVDPPPPLGQQWRHEDMETLYLILIRLILISYCL